MREQKLLAKEFEFYIADLDNMLLVQCGEDGSLTVRCTRDNLSRRRKVFFIRELAAEGFIPEEYQWFSETAIDSSRVQWFKDWSWVKVPETITGRSIKFILLACVLWMAAVRVGVVSFLPDPATTTVINRHPVYLSNADGERTSDHSREQ
ncbi:MAG TPA: hypothetical protein VKV04_10300 [Verrucomicrobiae bacterium]|nr:hypothetical protein [Verrucomicrobiae bacterium]